MPQSDRGGLRLTVLWRKIDENGDEYLAGPLTRDTGIAIFYDRKARDAELATLPIHRPPDAHVYLLPQRKKEPA